MSQENVAVVRAFLEAYNREDFEAALRYGTPDFVLDFSRALGPYRGIYQRDQVQGFLRELNATFESVRFEPGDFTDAGDLRLRSTCGRACAGVRRLADVHDPLRGLSSCAGKKSPL